MYWMKRAFPYSVLLWACVAFGYWLGSLLL